MIQARGKNRYKPRRKKEVRSGKISKKQAASRTYSKETIQPAWPKEEYHLNPCPSGRPEIYSSRFAGAIAGPETKARI